MKRQVTGAHRPMLRRARRRRAPRRGAAPAAPDHVGGRGVLRHRRPADPAVHLGRRRRTAAGRDAALPGQRVRPRGRQQVRRAGRGGRSGQLARPGHPRPAAGQCPLPGGDEPARPRRRATRGPRQPAKQCWGVLCLHREDAAHGFDDRGGRPDPADRPAPGRGAAAGRHRWDRSARPAEDTAEPGCARHHRARPATWP